MEGYIDGDNGPPRWRKGLVCHPINILWSLLRYACWKKKVWSYRLGEKWNKDAYLSTCAVTFIICSQTEMTLDIRRAWYINIMWTEQRIKDAMLRSLRTQSEEKSHCTIIMFTVLSVRSFFFFFCITAWKLNGYNMDIDNLLEGDSGEGMYTNSLL